MSTFFSAELFSHLAATLEVDEAAVIAAFDSFVAGKTKSKPGPKGKAKTKPASKKGKKAADVEAEDDAEPDLSKMTVAQLKVMCKEKEMDASGTKAVLIARLKGEEDADAEAEEKAKAKGKKAAPKAKAKAKATKAKKSAEDDEEAEAGDYSKMTVAELKEALGERGLTKSGKKDELIARLEEADTKGSDKSKGEDGEDEEDVEVEEEGEADDEAVAEEDAEVEGDEE